MELLSQWTTEENWIVNEIKITIWNQNTPIFRAIICLWIVLPSHHHRHMPKCACKHAIRDLIIEFPLRPNFHIIGPTEPLPTWMCECLKPTNTTIIIRTCNLFSSNGVKVSANITPQIRSQRIEFLRKLVLFSCGWSVNIRLNHTMKIRVCGFIDWNTINLIDAQWRWSKSRNNERL